MKRTDTVANVFFTLAYILLGIITATVCFYLWPPPANYGGDYIVVGLMFLLVAALWPLMWVVGLIAALLFLIGKAVMLLVAFLGSFKR